MMVQGGIYGSDLLQNGYPNLYSRKIGNKQYSIKDHLGNIRVTFADKKIPANGLLQDFVLETQSVSTYYPFGWEIEPLSWAVETFAFGYQGQEKDDELKGKSVMLNYKYRAYDSRVARFFAVDPLAAKYPWNSSYAFSENRVIDGIELEGLEFVYYRVVSIESNGKCAIQKTGKKEYNNWLLNLTDGLWGLAKLETPVVIGPFDGKQYMFNAKELQNLNISDFNNDRYKKDDIDAFNSMTDAVGSILMGLRVQKNVQTKRIATNKGGLNSKSFEAVKGGGTVKFADKVSPQKIKRHLKGSPYNDSKGYFDSYEDAQKVLDSYNSGNYRLIHENVAQNQVTIEVTSVTGTHVSKAKPGTNQVDVSLPTNIFTIQSSVSPKPFPVHPNKGL